MIYIGPITACSDFLHRQKINILSAYSAFYRESAQWRELLIIENLSVGLSVRQ